MAIAQYILCVATITPPQRDGTQNGQNQRHKDGQRDICRQGIIGSFGLFDLLFHRVDAPGTHAVDHAVNQNGTADIV